MGLRDENKTVLTFNLLMESANILGAEENSPWQLRNKLNSTAWMGKEPESCMVVDIKQKEAIPVGKTAMMDHVEFTIYVGYRPRGWISGEKREGLQRLNSWQLEVRDQMNDGTLLDGAGKPLPVGHPPVYLPYDIYELADFNDYDFGHFLGDE